MLRTTIQWMTIIVCILAAGCASQPVQQQPENLNEWVEQELAPYLVQQLANTPRFKNKPLIIVGMDNESIRTEIDDLTRHLRDQIKGKLLATPGIQLVRRQTGDATSHHRSLESVVCAQEQDIHYYIGLDVKQDNVTGNLSVAVRALDARNNLNWVSGFGKQYTVAINDREQQALTQVSTDEFLRGLRALPFNDDQSDLVANYLSHNLSCLLRQHREGGILLHVSRDQEVDSQYFNTTFDLVDDFITRFNEVTLTENPEQANTFLNTKVHAINPNKGLYIIAADVTRLEDATKIGGMATQAYVQVSPSLITQLSKPRTTPTRPSSTTQPRGKLLTDVTAIVPQGSQACADTKPWRQGYRPLGNGATIRSGECFAVEVTVKQNAHIQIMYLDPKGDVFRLIPSECKGLTGQTYVQANHVARYPAPDAGIPAIGLGNVTGKETVYVLAARNEAAQQKLQQAMSGYRDACSSGQGMGATRVADWEAILNQLVKQSRGDIEWRSVTLNHI